MDTSHLIDTLAADSDVRGKSAVAVLAPALLIAAVLSLSLLLGTLGLRPDFRAAMHNPFFDLKFVAALALASTALVVSLRVSRPEARLGRTGALLMLPLLVLGAAIAAEAMLPERAPMMTRLVGNNARICLVAIPALSLPLLAAALIGLRQGAPARPALAGAVAGLLAGGVAAALYAAHCTDDSPLFVAIWYTTGVAIVAGLGAAAGAKVLRY